MASVATVSVISAFTTLSKTFPGIAEKLDFNEVTLFVQLIAALRPQIDDICEPSNVPPPTLTRRFHEFFMASFGWDDYKTKVFWMVFKELGWRWDGGTDIRHIHPLLVQYGLKYEIGEFSL